VKLVRTRARCAAWLLPALALSAGCAQEPQTLSVRVLEQSGRVAFVCLAQPGVEPHPGLPLTQCNSQETLTPSEFGVGEDGVAAQPHIYALLAQTTRGEVAVIDVTSQNDRVIDLDPNIPGANFLPVGAQPVDIVATPGGSAAFVAVAEVGREGIFALPSTKLRPCAGCTPPGLGSFPACSLPSAPASMVLVADPLIGKPGEPAGADQPKQIRRCCGTDEYFDFDPNEPSNAGSCEEDAAGSAAAERPSIDLEGNGRQKLVVSMPELGGVAIFDAQDVLNRAEGSFEPCVPERWVPLKTDVPPPPEPPAPPIEAGCVNADPLPPAVQVSSPSRPAGISYAGGHLYVADLGAPVIHDIAMPTPCDPVERPPLVPTSDEEPTRAVTTSRVSVSRKLTSDLRRYLYAIDEGEGSVMAFDVSDDAAPRYPLRRPNAGWNPFQPRDRMRFIAPVKDVMLIDRDSPLPHPGTGAASEGTRCDPSPSLEVCTTASLTCDPATLYRTAGDYNSGAGPLRLRGTFAFMVLATGQVVVADIDDLDARCRIPSSFAGSLAEIFGCPPQGFDLPTADVGKVCAIPMQGQAPDPAKTCAAGETCSAVGNEMRCLTPRAWVSSRESSCNVVLPNALRSAKYMTSNDVVGDNEPGIQAFPLLYDNTGALVQSSEPLSPQMRATVPAVPPPDPPNSVEVNALHLTVGAGVFKLDPASGSIAVATGQTPNEEPEHTLIMNFEDPRAHTVNQPWYVTFEGVIRGFEGRLAESLMSKAHDPAIPTDELRDANSRFCDRGVQSQKSAFETLKTLDPAASDEALMAEAQTIADYVQILSELPPENDAYWNTKKTCFSDASPGEGPAENPGQGCSCTYQDCRAIFGNLETPSGERDLRIYEAYQDRIVVAPNEASRAQLKCCFPTLLEFTVRARNQWIVDGQGSGFLHHVIADPATGACRNSCDPLAARVNGRVRSAPSTLTKIEDGTRYSFMNPMFRFGIRLAPGTEGCGTNRPCENGLACNKVSTSQNTTTVTPCDVAWPSGMGTAPCVCDQAPTRDTQFRFVTQGAFVPLVTSLTRETFDVQPVAISFLEPTQEVVVSDGLLEGLFMISTQTTLVTKHIY
jgi:hypothetical protein